ncbi:hypothetical protein HAT93_01318 [Dickeya solani]|nr:hypothetical protein [Dickeya solani]QKO15496.1 hypothetical protein HAT91_03921 [Dickeya solani]
MQQTDSVIPYRQTIAFLTHIPRKTAMTAVVLKQVGNPFGVSQLINRHDRNLGPPTGLIQRAQYATTYATKTVYRNTDCHEIPCVVIKASRIIG